MESVLYHCHGLGRIDFSAAQPKDLDVINEIATQRNVGVVPTIFLRRDRLAQTVDLITAYGRDRERWPAILGFGIEGPLLGPNGGTPAASIWQPTVSEWLRIADLGGSGLLSVVLAPDAMALDEEIEPGFAFSDLLLALYHRGVRISIGHFLPGDAAKSAQRTANVVDFIHEHFESSRFLVLTDHLYNDMPRSFKHAWRTTDERRLRDTELFELLRSDWNRSNWPTLLGPLVAIVLGAAIDDRLLPCVNFDGEHVDIEIAKRTLEILGPDRLAALTDHTEVESMAGDRLRRHRESNLLVREDGIVAAGMTGDREQRALMLSAGIDEGSISGVFLRTPLAAIRFVPRELGV